MTKRSRPMILVVDDDAPSLMAMKALLGSLAAEVVEARCGSEALDQLLAHSIEVAILDVGMPEMNGFEVAETMRMSPRTREIPIIFVTGRQDAGKVFKGYEVGAVDYLMKPVNPLVLRSKVAVFLELTARRRELAVRVAELEDALEAERRARAEAVRAEAARVESEDRFRTLADNIAQLAWMADQQGGIFWFNRRWFEFTATSLQEVRGWGWQKLPHPDHVQRVVQKMRKCFAAGEPWEDTFPLRGKGGDYRWFLSRAVPIRDGNGEVSRWFGTNTDITEQRVAEENLRDLNERLLEADRRKNEFLAVLSHELRNPLAPIRNSVYILERATPGGEQANRAREVIDRQAQHMTRLIEDLLDVTRISRGKITLQREGVDINALARRTAEDHREIFTRNGVQLELCTLQEPLWVEGDPTRLAQVVGNLLTNSAKFTPQGGKTVLSVEADPAASATVRIRDNGVGMSTETVAHLFEPFVQAAQTLDRTRGGLGLGLALVKGLVEMHGGTVSAISEGEGRGSEFTIRLPLQAVARPRTAVVTPRTEEAKICRVLVIDDNVDAAESLRDVLELGGFEVVVAYSGPEGIVAARRHRPDIVLCDIGLPGLDGHGVARALRAEPLLKGAFLVALSGYALPEDVAKSMEAGFDRHVAKPPSMEMIESLMAVACRGRGRVEDLG